MQQPEGGCGRGEVVHPSSFGVFDTVANRASTDDSEEGEARKQMERGVFDIEVVKQANQTLIDTIEESLRIADEGKAARAKASTELAQLENDLRRTLASANARADGAAPQR